MEPGPTFVILPSIEISPVPLALGGLSGDRVEQARQGSTVRLGGLLAPYAIRYVVVVDNLAPSIPGFQTPLDFEPPLARVRKCLLGQVEWKMASTSATCQSVATSPHCLPSARQVGRSDDCAP